MRRRIPEVLTSIQAASAAAEILESAVDAPEEPAKTREELWQDRMQDQRRAWRAQDTRRFYDPDKTEEVPEVWCVYQWIVRRKRWDYVGQRPIKSHRRKPMTMNRLFAAIRYKFGINRDVPLKLISLADDIIRKRRGDPLAPPVHFRGRVS